MRWRGFINFCKTGAAGVFRYTENRRNYGSCIFGVERHTAMYRRSSGIITTYGYELCIFHGYAEDARTLYYGADCRKYLQRLRGNCTCKYGGNCGESIGTAGGVAGCKRTYDNLLGMASMKRRFKKYGVGVLFLFILLAFCSIPCSAENSDTQELQSIETLANEIYGEADDDAKALLNEMGLSEFSMESVLSLTPRTVIDTLLGILQDGFNAPLRAAVLLCAVSVLGSLAASFFPTDSKIPNAFDLCTVLLVTCILAQALTDLLESAFSAVNLTADFMLTYIPGFAGVIAMSGKPLTSAAYSSVMVGVSNLYMQSGLQYFLPLLMSYLFLSVVTALQEKFTLQPIVQCIKKIIYIFFGLAATVFSGLLTVKGALAAGGDSVAVKGVKMLVGSAVPIVGGALSEGVTSVLASAMLIKNTVGIFGILVIVCTVLPAVIQLLLWYLALTFSAAVSEALGQMRMKNLLQGVSGVLSVTNAFVIFTAYIFIVSTGIILQFRGT